MELKFSPEAHNDLNLYRATVCCLVCDTMEDPQANIVRRDIAWICPECKSILNMIVESHKSARKIAKEGIIPHHD